MGDFLSRTKSLTRFRLTEPVPNSLIGAAPDRLKQYAFQPIDAIPEKRAYGWVNFDDMLDLAWAKSPPQKGEYITFALRVDTRRIPPAILKKEYREALNQEEEKIKEIGKSFVTRDRKLEIKEQVALRLLQRIPPTPECFQAVWNPQTGRVLFNSTQAKHIEMFCEYFHTSFGLKLEQDTPYSMAERLCPEADIDAVLPTAFTRSDPGGIFPGCDPVLGQDYLMWLWHKGDTAPGVSLVHIGNNSFRANVGRKVVVVGGFGPEMETVACSGPVSTPAEAMKGLAAGKVISRAYVEFESGDIFFSMTLKAGELTLNSLKTPPIETGKTDDDPDGAFFEMMYLVELACDVFEESFKEYINLRMSRNWDARAVEIGAWINSYAD